MVRLSARLLQKLWATWTFSHQTNQSDQIGGSSVFQSSQSSHSYSLSWASSSFRIIRIRKDQICCLNKIKTQERAPSTTIKQQVRKMSPNLAVSVSAKYVLTKSITRRKTVATPLTKHSFRKSTSTLSSTRTLRTYSLISTEPKKYLIVSWLTERN